LTQIKIENFEPTSGQTDENQEFGTDELGKREKEKALRDDAAVKAKMSLPGSLGLPALLDARRCEWGITDGAFREHSAFERILVHQIPTVLSSGGKVGGGTLWMPNTSQDAENRMSCRGIIVSAGLKALDSLRTNGMDLGHIIQFIHLAPFSIPVDYLSNGEHRYLLNLNVGDVLSSEDLALQIRKGEMGVYFQEFGENSHHIVWPVARAAEVHLATLPVNPYKDDSY
jgi:hypothetical protein